MKVGAAWCLLVIMLLAKSAWADDPIEGQRDPDFGGQGTASVVFELTNPNSDAASALARAPSGRLYLAASVSVAVNGMNQRRIGLARLTANGALDNGFNGDGIAVPLNPIDAGYEILAQDIEIQSDGKPLVLATRDDLNDGKYAPKIQVCRYAVAGNLDNSFDGDGCALPVVGLVENPRETARQFSVLGNGAILVLATVRDHPQILDSVSGALYKLQTNGERDAGFGAGTGFVLLKPAFCSRCGYRSLKVLPDGSVLVFGTDEASLSFVSKVTPQGTLDSSFGVGGHAVFSFANLNPSPINLEQASAIVSDSQGRIYACGSVQYELNQAKTLLAVARLTAAGQLDPAFSDDGRLLRPAIDVLETSTVESCLVDAADRLVLGVQVGNSAPLNGDYAAIRLLPTGDLDPRFNFSGIIRVPIDLGGPAIGNDILSDMIADDTGLILAGTSLAQNLFLSDAKKLTVVRLRDDRLLRDGFE